MNYTEKIKEIAQGLGKVRIMEVCGGHTNVILKYGIRDILPANIKLISGPGCPVCVTSQHDIDCMIELALQGIKVATYGDMMKVPGTKMSLNDAKARGADIQMLYSVDQITEKDRVFFAIGFETTTPMTAALLRRGHIIYSTHKLIPPPMKILTREMNIDGFIDPGHVSSIIGSKAWEEMGIPVSQVIAGFEPEALLRATYRLLELIRDRKVSVINEYKAAVKPEGNPLALKMIKETMKVVDSEWRGLGSIPASGLDPINPKQDAKVIYADMLSKVITKEETGCRCGEVIRGMIEPRECPLFRKACTPEDPKGACMVSTTEGACAIAFKYGKALSE